MLSAIAVRALITLIPEAGEPASGDAAAITCQSIANTEKTAWLFGLVGAGRAGSSTTIRHQRRRFATRVPKPRELLARF
jgi:hypothetical protein